MGEKLWSLATTGAAIGGGILAKKVAEGGWKFITGNDSPANPEDPDTEWAEALVFAVISGAIVQLARVLINRQSTQAFKKSTGRLPKSVTSS
ncbi:MAG: DUF4235 domain-containing protein [Ornithinimicrobium sp.]